MHRYLLRTLTVCQTYFLSFATLAHILLLFICYANRCVIVCNVRLLEYVTLRNGNELFDVFCAFLRSHNFSFYSHNIWLILEVLQRHFLITYIPSTHIFRRVNIFGTSLVVFLSVLPLDLLHHLMKSHLFTMLLSLTSTFPCHNPINPYCPMWPHILLHLYVTATLC